MNTVQYRGVARIFPEVHTIFKSPYPPPPSPLPTNMKITCSHFIPSSLLSACILKYIIKIHMKTNFLMWEKRVCFLENRSSGVEKTNSPLFQEKYSKESNRDKTEWRHFMLPSLLFNVYSLFYFVLFHLFFTLDLYAHAYCAYR